MQTPNSVDGLEARLRRVTLIFGLAITVIAIVVAFAWVRASHHDVLSVQTLRIVDEHGVERVRIGGELPNAASRGDQAAGVLIYDNTGQERGGYVTFDRGRNAVLTLDTRKGMVVLLAADSTEGAALRLWGSDFADWLDLRAGSAGPRLTVARANEIVLQQPPMLADDAARECDEIKSELSRLAVQPPVQEVLRACKQHMPEAACRACLHK